MTTYFSKKQSCGACGKRSSFSVVASTNECGAPDLDLRPAPMVRHTLDTWVQRCPHCGYCARDLSEEQPGLYTLVRSAGYQAILSSDRYPELANSFRCLAAVCLEQGKIAGAAGATMQAAWVCDDAGEDAGAVECRAKALVLLREAASQGQSLYEDAATQSAVVVDLLRRTRRWDEASQEIARAMKASLDPMLRDVFRLQTKLIEGRDAGCHQLDLK